MCQMELINTCKFFFIVALINLRMICPNSEMTKYKPCHFSFVKTSNHGITFYYLFENEIIECFMDVNRIQDNATIKFPNVSSVLNLYFACNNATIHFDSKQNMEINLTKRIQLRFHFYQCHLQLDELLQFKHFGDITSFSHEEFSNITVSDQGGSIIRNLKFLSSSLNCMESNTSQFFWETCAENFDSLYSLELKGCQNYRLNPKTLKKKFPNVHALSLTSIYTLTEIRFPWTNQTLGSLNETNKEYYERFNKEYYEHFAEPILKFGNKYVFKQSLEVSNTELTYDSFVLAGCIESITITKANLKKLKRDFFLNVTDVTELDLSKNHLKELDPMLFLHNINMSKLVLRKNELDWLDPNIFHSLVNLRILDLSNNNLNKIDTHLLASMKNLNELHLENNRLEVLPRNFLKNQVNSIQWVYLQENPLTTIPAYPIIGEHLEMLDMHNTQINTQSLNNLYSSNIIANLNVENILVNRYLQHIQILDFTFCQITSLATNFLVDKPFQYSDNVFKLFRKFYIKGEGNPINCTCTSVLYIDGYDETGIPNLDWKCMYPLQFEGQSILSLKLEDLLCPLNDTTDCPKQCSCYERHNQSTAVVDCSNVNMTVLPQKLPEAPNLELKFRNSSLASISTRKYFKNVTILDISYNTIKLIEPATLQDFPRSMDSLLLNNNHLSALPIQLKSYNISKISLGKNPFVCNCHTRWMKTWLLARTTQVTDWSTVKCTYNKSKDQQLIVVPDSVFVCQHINHDFHLAEHVIFPSIIIGCTLFVLVSISLLLYFQRFRVKVLMYIYFGIHPFDKHNEKIFELDAYIIYSERRHEFINNTVVQFLKAYGFNAVRMYEDFIIGLSKLENMEVMMKKSKRIIFVMSDDLLQNELLENAWNIAYKYAVKGAMNSLILVASKDYCTCCTNENIKQYVKSGRFIYEHSRLLQQSILYLMPEEKTNLRRTENGAVTGIDNCLLSAEQGNDENILLNAVALTEDENENVHNENMTLDTENIKETEDKIVCLTYDDNHDEVHKYVQEILIPFLGKNGYKVRIFDEAHGFAPGTDVRDSIEAALKNSQHYIFILSQTILHPGQDVKYYMLQEAISFSKICGNNYLLLIMFGDIVAARSTELKRYIETQVTCSFENKHLQELLMKSLAHIKPTKNNDAASESDMMLHDFS